MLQKGNQNPFLKGAPQKKHLDFKLSEKGDPFHGASQSERLNILIGIGQEAERAFEKLTLEIKEILRTYNVLQVLGHFAYYDHLLLDGVDQPDYTPIEQSSLEWLQALVLQIEEEVISRALNTSPFGEPLLKLNRAINDAHKAFGAKRLGKQQKHNALQQAAEMIRQHTAFVRNEGFPSQIRKLRAEIFRPIDHEFSKREGLSLSEIDTFLVNIFETVRGRLNDDLSHRMQILSLKSPQEIIVRFANYIKKDPAKVTSEFGEYATDIMAVRAAVINDIDRFNYRHFYFSIEQFEDLFCRRISRELSSSIIQRMSISLGELSVENPEHFVLANPIWKRPFIALGNNHYFIPAIGLIQSFGLDVIEHFLEGHKDLKKKYQDRCRADLLENRTEELARKAFPSAKIYRSLKWRGSEGHTYENDILVLLDTHALIFECKSGAIRARAQRGDTAVLSQELRELIDEPSIQGKRFADFLLRQKSVVQLTDDAGRLQTLDLRRILRATAVNVMLDYVGPIATQFDILRESGIRSEGTPVATITLHDLECVLDILDRQAMAFHYLRRRAELEARCKIITDEMGFLALYLGTSFDLGDYEGDPSKTWIVSNLSEQLVPYFMGKEIGQPVLKPQLRLRGWWKDLLNTFEEKNFPGWLESSYTLLCSGFDRQKEFEKHCKKLIRKVRTKWHQDHDDTCIMINGGKDARVATLAIAVKNRNREERRALVSNRLGMVQDEHQPVRSIAICLSASERIYPYLGVYFHCPEFDQTDDSGIFQRNST